MYNANTNSVSKFVWSSCVRGYKNKQKSMHSINKIIWLSLEIEYLQTTCYWKTKNPHLKMGNWKKHFDDVKIKRGVRKTEINLLMTTTDILKWRGLKLNFCLHTGNSQRLLHLFQRNHSTTFIMQRTIMSLHNIIKVSPDFLFSIGSQKFIMKVKNIVIT